MNADLQSEFGEAELLAQCRTLRAVSVNRTVEGRCRFVSRQIDIEGKVKSSGMGVGLSTVIGPLLPSRQAPGSLSGSVRATHIPVAPFSGRNR